MSKFCPITGGRVVYLVCQECTDRACEQRSKYANIFPKQNNESRTTPMEPRVTILPKKENPTHDINNNHEVVSEAVQKPQNAQDEPKAMHPGCETCMHKCGERKTTMFGRTFQAIQCKIFHNRIFTSEMVVENGCDYHNRDISQEKICLNCEHYLGGGDWGLACKADYYRLPNSTDKACAKFKRLGDSNG